MVVGRDRVGNIVFFRGLSARAAIATVIKVENAKAALEDSMDF